MGLTQVSTAGVKDDAVTAGKIPANAVGASELADNAVDTAAIADDAVTADKLANAINTDIAAKTVLTGSTNNTVATVTGANAIQGEANLTFDGDGLAVSAKLQVTHDNWDTARVENTNADANGAYLDLVKNSASPADGDETGVIRFRADDDAGNEHTFAVIRGTSPDVSNGAENGQIEFQTSSGGTVAERLRITQSGNLKILDGDLQINTAGHGIDFSTHGNAGGMTAELLDDYEEGNFTPSVSGSSGTGTPAYSAQHGKYTKVGRLVSVVFDLNVSSWSGASGSLQVLLPFANGSFAAGTSWYYSPVWHSIDTNFIGSTGNYRSGYMGQSSTALLPRIIGDTNNDAGMNVNTTGRIAGSMTYITDS